MDSIKGFLDISYGDGSGWGYSYGSGSGWGKGSGLGSGKGNGSGSGKGNGSGSGSGYGDGSGGIKSINGNRLYDIDGVPTMLNRVRGNVARGRVLNADFTTKPCYVVKGDGFFAHGDTLEEAREALREKIYENLDEDEAIEKFIDSHKKGEKYPGMDFFNWHHYLTGSCDFGRRHFVETHGLDLDAEYTVDEFIELTENDYGGETIRKLKARWDKSKGENI